MPLADLMAILEEISQREGEDMEVLIDGDTSFYISIEREHNVIKLVTDNV